MIPRPLLVVAVLGLLHHASAQNGPDCMNVTGPMDITFVVDASGSICGGRVITVNPDGTRTCDNWIFVRDFIIDFVDGLNFPNTSFSLIRFASSSSTLITHASGCSNSRAAAAVCVDQRLTFTSGGTQTAEALMRAFNNECFESRLDKPQCVVILITDGRPSMPISASAFQSQRLQTCGCTVFVIGITDSVSVPFLVAVSSPPKQENRTYFISPTFDSLQLTPIKEQICMSSCRVPPDVCVMVDGSGSIGRRKFVELRQGVNELLVTLGIGSSRVAVVLYSDNAAVICGLDEANCQDNVTAMMYPGGHTNTYLALEKCMEIFDNDNGPQPNIGLIITDGGSQDKPRTFLAATKARMSMEICAVGCGGWVDLNELKAIASHHHSGHVLAIPSVADLSRSAQDIVDKVCKREDHCTRSPCRNGGSCVPRIDTYICDCVNGWSGKNCSYRCRVPADFVFGVDESGSVRQENWLNMIDCAKNVTLYLPLGNGHNDSERAQLGFCTFSDTFTRVFGLATHATATRTAILDAMTIPHYGRGSTNTAGFLNAVREQKFNASDGNRADFADVTAIFLAGRSNSVEAAWLAALQNRLADINHVAVSVNGRNSRTELLAIGGHGNNVFDNCDARSIADRICRTDDRCRPNPCVNRGVCTNTFAGYWCQCPVGFSGINCERGCAAEVDIALVLDCSRGIAHQNFDAIKEMLIAVISHYHREARVSLVTFADSATVRFFLDDYSDPGDIATAIRFAPYCGGGTNVAEALRTVRRDVFTLVRGDRAGVQNLVFVFSDGGHSREAHNTMMDAARLRMTGARVIAMAASTLVNRFVMGGIASEPVVDNFVYRSSIHDVLDLVPLVVDASCNDANNCSNVACANGGTCVDGYDSFTCIGCREDYTDPLCDRFCNRTLDVVMVLDASGSVEEVCSIGLRLLERVVLGLNVDSGKVRVAFVQYQTTSVIEFDLAEYSSAHDVLEAMFCYQFRGRTNTQAALEDARVLCSNQSRIGVDSVVILATDGYSNVGTPIQLANTVQRLQDDCRVCVAGIGPDVNIPGVLDIASGPGYYVGVPTSTDVEPAAAILLNKICGTR